MSRARRSKEWFRFQGLHKLLNGLGSHLTCLASAALSCSNFRVFYSDVMILGPMPDPVANASSRPTMAISMLVPNPSLANIHCQLQIQAKLPPMPHVHGPRHSPTLSYPRDSSPATSSSLRRLDKVLQLGLPPASPSGAIILLVIRLVLRVGGRVLRDASHLHLHLPLLLHGSKHVHLLLKHATRAAVALVGRHVAAEGGASLVGSAVHLGLGVARSEEDRRGREELAAVGAEEGLLGEGTHLGKCWWG